MNITQQFHSRVVTSFHSNFFCFLIRFTMILRFKNIEWLVAYKATTHAQVLNKMRTQHIYIWQTIYILIDVYGIRISMNEYRAHIQNIWMWTGDQFRWHIFTTRDSHFTCKRMLYWMIKWLMRTEWINHQHKPTQCEGESKTKLNKLIQCFFVFHILRNLFWSSFFLTKKKLREIWMKNEWRRGRPIVQKTMRGIRMKFFYNNYEIYMFYEGNISWFLDRFFANVEVIKLTGILTEVDIIFSKKKLSINFNS